MSLWLMGHRTISLTMKYVKHAPAGAGAQAIEAHEEQLRERTNPDCLCASGMQRTLRDPGTSLRPGSSALRPCVCFPTRNPGAHVGAHRDRRKA